jgi:hypothetical protein
MIEFRLKQQVKEKDGSVRVQTYSTRSQGKPQPKFVVFPWFRGESHYDLVSIEERGELMYVLPAAKAATAEALIDAFILGSKEVKHLAGLPSGDVDEKEFNKFLDGALGLMEDAEDEESFLLVENRNSKRKKKKADKEAKAAAAEKAAAKKAETESEERIVKATAKAVADAVREHEAKKVSWAAQPPLRAGGWGHRPDKARPAASPSGKGTYAKNHVPAVVVFGEGSKRGLRRELREVSADLDQAVSAVFLVEAGAPRAHLHCAEEDREMVQSFLPKLKASGLGCAAYEERRGGGATEVPLPRPSRPHVDCVTQANARASATTRQREQPVRLRGTVSSSATTSSTAPNGASPRAGAVRAPNTPLLPLA